MFIIGSFAKVVNTRYCLKVLSVVIFTLGLNQSLAKAPITLNMNRIYGYLVLALLLGSAWTWVNRLPSSTDADPTVVRAPRPNFAAPEFLLAAVTGETQALEAHKGKVVLVNFWATWCGPCRAEMPAIEDVYQANRERGLVVLAVDQQEDATSVTAFAQQFGLTFPLLLDMDAAVARRYHVSALPTTFFVDSKGVIRDMTIGGPMTRASIESKIDALLNEAPP